MSGKKLADATKQFDRDRFYATNFEDLRGRRLHEKLG
jgi:hypothetical protein